MTTLTRDIDKAAVYSAEQQLRRILQRQHECPTVVVAGSTLSLPAERKFGDLQGVQRYVDLVLDLPWVYERWGRKTIRVVERQGQDHAHYSPGSRSIAVPVVRVREDGTRWAMRELVVLHEIAHALAWSSARQDHGPEFREAFAELASICMGQEIGFMLQVFFHQNCR